MTRRDKSARDLDLELILAIVELNNPMTSAELYVLMLKDGYLYSAKSLDRDLKLLLDQDKLVLSKVSGYRGKIGLRTVISVKGAK